MWIGSQVDGDSKKVKTIHKILLNSSWYMEVVNSPNVKLTQIEEVRKPPSANPTKMK